MKEANLIECSNLGMTRDKSISKLNGEQYEFAYDNHNIRITTHDGDTSLSVTNEKGTILHFSINGTLLGSCVIASQLVLFVHNEYSNKPDSIYKVVNETPICLYNGNLNFNLDYPIETLGYYESENVLKVYWVDGLNPNRFINIESTKIQPDNNTQFDCKGTISKTPKIIITKDYNLSGNFPGGVIQYFITYYNKFGTETGIVWQSDLQYSSKVDRGCKEGESASNVFKLHFSNIDKDNYEYIRIYATHRTSYLGQPLTYVVADLETKSIEGEEYIDDGIGLQQFSTADLNFVGGLNIIASTLDLKQDTLFLGDIKIDNTIIPTDSTLFKSLQKFKSETYENNNVEITLSSADISFIYKPLPTPEFKNTYAYENQLNESQADIAGFKYREVYRFGILFQTEKGEWTNPIYIGDKYCDLPPKLNKSNIYEIAQATYEMNQEAKEALLAWNNDSNNTPFINVRLLVAEITPNDRRIVAQGVINPTMFNYYDRLQNKPYSINSWMFRPRQSLIINRHYDCMHEQSHECAEIQGIVEKHLPGFDPINVDPNTANSYALLIGLSGDWITRHDIAYVVYKYSNDGKVDFYESYPDEEGNKIDEKVLSNKQGSHNKLIKNTDGTLCIVRTCGGSTAAKARQQLVDYLAKDLNITDAMIPTAQELKRMARATLTTDKPDLIWSIVGAAIATVASVVVTCLTFGTLAPGAAAGLTAVWSGVIAAVGTIGAAAGTSGIATIANQLKNAPEIDRVFAKQGMYTLLPNFQHSLSNKQKFKDQYESWLDGLFNTSDDPNFTLEEKVTPNDEFIGFLNEGDNKATLIQQVGRLTFKSPKELDAEQKQEQYYVDESIVTLNSPDLKDGQFIIDDAQSLLLDLIGTIPITAALGDVSMYTNTNGIAATASPLPKQVIAPYVSADIEGLINGPLYQDIDISNWNVGDNGKWPDISPQVALDSYKIFMWHRNTSWSVYIPGVNIIDPISVNDENNKTYLNYIPAIPKKKVIANIRYSHNTNYLTIHSLDIESPQIFTQGYDGIVQFLSNDTYRTYYGNVNNLVLNTNGYVLLKGNNLPAWNSPEDNTQMKYLYDPISIKFNSTDHAIIPLKWDDNLKTQTILPSLTTLKYELEDYYTLTTTNIIEGFVNLQPDANTEIITFSNAYVTGMVSNGDDFLLQMETPYSKTYTFTTPTILTVGCNEYISSNEEVSAPYMQILGTNDDNVGIRCTISSGDTNLATALVSRDNRTTLNITLDPGTYTLYYSPVGYCDVTDFDENNPIVYASATITGELYVKTLSVHHYINKCDTLSWNESHPYLFIGELVKKDFYYDSWLGGILEFAILQLNWNVCSLPIAIGRDITNTWGDTYYQRWDCLKTYPTTEEDANSVVDILSFMVETHVNLDGRCDVNRGVNNLINVRPNNFNINNSVYSQPDNIFQYKIVDKKFEDNTQENQVVWSLTKNLLDDVDKWTQINTVNFLNLNGNYGRLRKIINVNDVLLAFQDKSISTIDYNLKTALSTTDGVPVQLGNTNKVTGFTTISNTIGCYNKWSINLNSSGLYFIDDYNKSFNRYTMLNGIESLSTTLGFSEWFKTNIHDVIWSPNNNTAFKTSYDELTKDLYLINDETALVYNSNLNRFISFMDYLNCPLVINHNNKSIIIHQGLHNISFNEMFAGEYNYLINDYKPYWITYRLNPSAYTDNLFTNFTSVVDMFDDKLLDNVNTPPFNKVTAWNEYLFGELDLTKIKNRHQHAKYRYRIWHGDIPRDGDTLTTHIYGGNRMRNPWLYLKLTNDNTDNKKMVFHNLTVTYYK